MIKRRKVRERNRRLPLPKKGEPFRKKSKKENPQKRNYPLLIARKREKADGRRGTSKKAAPGGRGERDP